MDNEVAEARARLAARFGKSTQLGSKGTYTAHISSFFRTFAFGPLFNSPFYCRNSKKSHEEIKPRHSKCHQREQAAQGRYQEVR